MPTIKNLSTEDNEALITVYVYGPHDDIGDRARSELERRGLNLAGAAKALDRIGDAQARLIQRLATLKAPDGVAA
jgi:hypothetical protein